MIVLLKKACFATRLAPFLILPFLGAVAPGCGESPQVDPNIKAEKGKKFDESVSKSRTSKGGTPNPEVQKQKLGRGRNDVSWLRSFSTGFFLHCSSQVSPPASFSLC